MAPKNKHHHLNLVVNVFIVLIMTVVDSSLLFVLHDAGESYMSLDPINSLVAQGIPTSVLALGEPASTLFANLSFASTLSDIGINVSIMDGTPQARAQLLRPFDVDLVTSYFSTNGVPTVLCTGMVYAMEAQISLAFKSLASPSYIVGLDDSFSLWSNNSLPARLFVESYGDRLAVADEVFTSASSISEGVIAMSEGKVVATTVGNPSLENWAQDFSNLTQISTTRSIILNHYIDADQYGDIIVLIFAGGYGSDGYVDSLVMLCTAAQELKQYGYLFVFR
jgi:hypothetical protein